MTNQTQKGRRTVMKMRSMEELVERHVKAETARLLKSCTLSKARRFGICLAVGKPVEEAAKIVDLDPVYARFLSSETEFMKWVTETRRELLRAKVIFESAESVAPGTGRRAASQYLKGQRSSIKVDKIRESGVGGTSSRKVTAAKRKHAKR